MGAAPRRALGEQWPGQRQPEPPPKNSPSLAHGVATFGAAAGQGGGTEPNGTWTGGHPWQAPSTPSPRAGDKEGHGSGQRGSRAQAVELQTMHRAQVRSGTSRASGDPRAAPPSPGIPPKRAKVTAEPGAPEEGPARPAAPAFVRKLKNAAIGTGCDIRLRVVAVGNPRPSLRWYRNEELLAPREEEYGTLWIRDSKKEDAGVYTCIAENESGEAMTSAVLAIIDMEGKGGVAATTAALAWLRAWVCQGWPKRQCFAGSHRGTCPGPARAGLCCTPLSVGWGVCYRQHRGSSLAWSEHVAAAVAARPGSVPGLGMEVVGACDTEPARGSRRERRGSGVWHR